ncbi:MAG: tetratricopeptide repeat protein [Pirellula sp.]
MRSTSQPTLKNQKTKSMKSREQPGPQRRLMWMMAWIIGGTGVSILTWIALSPLPPLDPVELAHGPNSIVNLSLPDSEPKVASGTVANSYVEVLPKSEPSLTVGQLTQELLSIAQRLQSDFPSVVDAHHVAAMVYAELKQIQNAETAWKKCIELRAKEAGPYVGLAKILTDRGEEALAAELLQNFRKNGEPTGELYVELSRVHSALGELGQADLAIDDGLGKFPNEKSLWLQRGLVHSQLRKFDSAEVSLRKAIELGDLSDSTFNSLTIALIRNGKQDEAEKLRSVAEAANKSKSSLKSDSFQDDYMKSLRELGARLIRFAAIAAKGQGKLEQAEKWLLRSIAIQPSDLENYMELSALFRNTRRFENALEVQQELLIRQPENVYNYVNLASVASSLGNFALAEKVLTEATQKCPTEPFPYGELARICLAKRDFTAVGRWSEHARSLEPRNIEWYIMPAIAARELGRSEEYVRLMEQAWQISPNDPRLQALIIPTAP